jgi:hypothetical protein
MATSHAVHGWGSVLAILMSGALHFHVSSRIGADLSITAPTLPPRLSARHGARTCILIAMPLLGLERLVLNPEWLLHDHPEKLAEVQSLLLVFATIIWIITLRLQRPTRGETARERKRGLPGPLLAHAIILLLVIRTLLPTVVP